MTIHGSKFEALAEDVQIQHEKDADWILKNIMHRERASATTRMHLAQALLVVANGRPLDGEPRTRRQK